MAGAHFSAKEVLGRSPGCLRLRRLSTYLRIAPRSGLAIKGIDIAAGVVDPDCHGELEVIMVNSGLTAYVVAQGSRIAQIILERIFTNAEVEIVSSFPTTTRGTNAF